MNHEAQIEKLIAEGDELEERLVQWQHPDFDAPTAAAIRRGEQDYGQWYARCMRLVPEDRAAEFKDLYEGGTFIQRIRAFLADPMQLNDFYDESLEGNPFVDKFRHPFVTTFKENLAKQRAILVMSMHSEEAVVGVLDDLSEMFTRFPEFLRSLRTTDNPHVPEPTIENEKDFQALVHALLRLHYDDVRAEDPVSQQAGASSRVDFLLRESGVIIETKMTRPSLNDKKLGEELIIDWARYRRHPDCRAILALVYDPSGRVVNISGLIEDLSQTHEIPATRVVVIR